MEELSISTPALLFSAISLLMLAYTNRFLALAQLVRTLHDKYKAKNDSNILGQIKNLRKRVHLIRSMQVAGIMSLLICVICMFLIYIHFHMLAEILFSIALILLIVSLALSVWEIQISVKALDINMSNMEENDKI
jgi:peptidoglycan/LPS O-acetylase OafA/YrhL